ncbi:MAG: flagellin [Paenibacillus sp.]|nr:flagellin [Paenibacillus sp.]
MTVQFSAVLQAVSNYNKLQQAGNVLTQQLAAGKRIISPRDNPVLYNRITTFRDDISRFDTYLSNMNEGLSVVSQVQDAVTEQLGVLTKMLGLANESKQGGTSQNERNAYNAEYVKLNDELNNIVNNTTFNSQTLLDGSFATNGSGFMINTGQNVNYEINFMNTTTASDGLNLDGTSITSNNNANTAITRLEDAIDSLTSMQRSLGTDEFIVESRSTMMESKQTELELLIDKYEYIDPVKISAQLDQNQMLQQYALAAIAYMSESRQNMIDYLFP